MWPQAYWLLTEHITHEWWGYCDCIYPSFVSLKEFGVVGLDTYTRGIKDFHKCWRGSLAKRRLCLGPAGVINCTPLSALSFWVSLFPGKRSYNSFILCFYEPPWQQARKHDFVCDCENTILTPQSSRKVLLRIPKISLCTSEFFAFTHLR